MPRPTPPGEPEIITRDYRMVACTVAAQPAAAAGRPRLRFVPQPVDDAWALERDCRLAEFLGARMDEVEATSCRDERKALGWILDVLPDWLAERERVRAVDDPSHTSRVDMVGWIPRQVTHSRWSRHPGWEPAFHPTAASAFAQDTGEIRP